MTRARTLLVLAVLALSACGRGDGERTTAQRAEIYCLSVPVDLRLAIEQYERGFDHTSLGYTSQEARATTMEYLFPMFTFCTRIRKVDEQRRDALIAEFEIHLHRFTEARDRAAIVEALQGMLAVAETVDALPIRE